VWMCRVYPFSTTSTVDVQGVSLYIACSVAVQGAFINSPCSVDVEGVSLSSDVQGLYPFPTLAVWMAGWIQPTPSTVWRAGCIPHYRQQ